MVDPLHLSENLPERLTLALPAQVTQENASSLLESLLGKVKAAGKTNTANAELHVDAGALNRFDSCALALLLAIRRQAQATRRTFSVANLPQELLSLAQTYGVGSLLEPDQQPSA